MRNSPSGSLSSAFFMACVLITIGCGGTRQGNPGGTSMVDIAVAPIQQASISQLSMCFTRLRLFGSSSQAPVQIAIASTEISASAVATALAHAEVPSGSYNRLEADLDSGCVSGKSLKVTNTHGTFSSTSGITLRFNGVFSLAVGATHSMQLEGQFIADALPSVASDNQVKSSAESVPGEVILQTSAAAGYPETVLSDSPVGYWRLDEPVGTENFVRAVHDSSGANACDGQPCDLAVQQYAYVPVFGEPGSSARTGSSVYFAGGHTNYSKPVIGSYPFVTVYNFTDGVSTDSPFSVDAIVKTSSTSIRGVIAAAYHSNNSRSWRFGVDSSNRLYVRFIHRDNEAIYIGRKYSTPLAAGSWYHVAFSYDASKASSGIRLYVNGVRVDDINDQNGIYTGFRRDYTSFTIGDTTSSNDDGYIDGFGGWIDEVAVYPGVLPSGRVLAHQLAR